MKKIMRRNTKSMCPDCNVFTSNLRRHKQRKRCSAVRERRQKR